jgi:hypothetical protein
MLLVHRPMVVVVVAALAALAEMEHLIQLEEPAA